VGAERAGDARFGLRRQALVDIGLALLVLVVVSTAVTANVGGTAPEPHLVAYSFGAVLGGLMLVRRRWPTATLVLTATVLVVYYMLSFPPVGLAVPVAAALYSAAEHGRTAWAIGTACSLLVVSTLARIREGDSVAYLLGLEFATSAGLMAAVIALGDSVRARRGWRNELGKQVRAVELEREREAAARVQQERLRIARDLHDLLAHTVSVISLHTDVARETLREDPETAERSLVAARAACSGAVRELRATLGALRVTADGEEDRQPLPTLDELDTLVSSVRAAGLDVQIRTSGTRPAMTAVADATTYRVIQESLSNTLRHAQAHNVVVELHYRDDAVLLLVRDDGQGSDLGRPGTTTEGWGIIGMRERLALLGGSVRVRSQRGGGFVVEAFVPVKGEA
jgi:signal transduction histidine kinase